MLGLCPQRGKEAYPGKGGGEVGQPLSGAEGLVAKCEPHTATGTSCAFHLLDREAQSWVELQSPAVCRQHSMTTQNWLI